MFSRQLSEGILHPRSSLLRNRQLVVLPLIAGFAVDFRRRYIQDGSGMVRGKLAGTQGKIDDLLCDISALRQNPQRSYRASQMVDAAESSAVKRDGPKIRGY